jgi:hypothetical protein
MATPGVGQPFNRQYPSGFTYPIDEAVFKRKNFNAFTAYNNYKKDLYEQGKASGTPGAQALEDAGLFARKKYFQEAVRVGAAVDPSNDPTAATVPVPNNSRQTPLDSNTPAPGYRYARPGDPIPVFREPGATRPVATPPSPTPSRPAQSTTGTASTTKTGSGGSTAKSNVTSNILHNYVNYTYRLSLYALRDSEFNRLVSGATKVNRKLLISSGGSGKNKAKGFDLDFYFEDLDVSTIISPTSSNRETNAYDVNFTIFEPNGCTLIDRLIAVTKELTGPGEDNYLTMPYLLEISFLGYDEQGNPQSVDVAEKTIPVYLTEMKIKPGLDGTRYVIRAQPFNQTALTQTAGVVPTNCEIKAETVEALFKSTGVRDDNIQTTFDTFVNTTTAANEALAQSWDNNQRAVANQAVTDAAQQVRQPIKASSLGNFLNEWQEYLVKYGMIGVADQYDFVFEPEIGISKVILPQLNPAQGIPTNNSTKSSADAAALALLNARRAGIALSSTGQGVSRIFAGSTITQILAYAIRHCEFILNQLPDDGPTSQANPNNTDSRSSATPDSSRNNSTPASKEEKILKWFWIIPKVEILQFDKIRNTYAKKITYTVGIYDSPNPRYPDAPQGRARDYVKEYHYWYTGKNSDILSVDINFDTAFYTSVSFRGSADLQARVRPSVGGIEMATDDDIRRAQERNRLLAKTGIPFPVVTYPSKQQADLSAAGNTALDRKAIAVDDLAESLMSRSRGDMVTMKLEILGDPDFIKQDGIFGDVHNRSSNKFNGSLITDHGRVVVKFNFNYPNDWGRDRGLLTARAHPTVFEGLYGVVKVESKFERGLFKQVLDLYRLDEKQYNEPPPEARSRINPLTGVITGGSDPNNALIDDGT